jgi:hypothetical protein
LEAPPFCVDGIIDPSPRGAYYQHVADAVLLKAADSIADETAKLMGEVAPEAAVVPLRG